MWPGEVAPGQRTPRQHADATLPAARQHLALDHRGEGYATETSELLLEHAFEQLGLHKVYTSVYDVNEPSLRVMEKLGMTKEGILRDERYVNGEYVDEHYFGMLAHEWRDDG